MSDIQEKYGDQIYRPGEDDVDNLSEEEMTERRAKVIQMFESGKTDFSSDDER